MPYRRNNYDFVIDSSFTPFTMQEMLTPVLAYKDAFEKSEAAYTELSDKADKYSYLANSLDPESKAAQIYNGYANELRAQANDLATNGLTMSNRRALTSLKRRYQGEIGILDQADAALQKERELRRAMNAKDNSMLYATDNLSIDDFLGNNTPNLYSVSGNDLRTLGMNAGKAASSRIYSAGDEGSTLGGYYRKWTERNGYSADSINAFRENAAAIPELQQAADAILAERGVNNNLTGDNLQRARLSVINGIIDGAIYKEDSKPVEDRGVMSAGQAAQIALSREQMNKSAAMNGLTWNDATKSWEYSLEKDPSAQRQLKVAEYKAQHGGGSSKGGSTEHTTQLKQRTRIKWNGDNPASSVDNFNNHKVETLADDEKEHSGAIMTYDELPDYAKKMVDKIIGDGRTEYYQYYFKPFEEGLFNDSEAELELVPRNVITDDAFQGFDDLFGLQ